MLLLCLTLLSKTSNCPNPIAAQSGHYEWHNDIVMSVDENQVVPNKTRKLSMTIVLNDDYEGCDFECGTVKKGNLIGERVPLKKGDVIVFPSMMHHRVHHLKLLLVKLRLFVVDQLLLYFEHQSWEIF